MFLFKVFWQRGFCGFAYLYPIWAFVYPSELFYISLSQTIKGITSSRLLFNNLKPYRLLHIHTSEPKI
jgi:hypothetical protein